MVTGLAVWKSEQCVLFDLPYLYLEILISHLVDGDMHGEINLNGAAHGTKYD